MVGECLSQCAGEAASVHHIAASIKRAADNAITSLEDGDGLLQAGRYELEGLVLQHFSKVFAASEEAMGANNELLTAIEASIMEEDNKALLEPITQEELLAALKSCPRSKSPGEDGLTAEFFLASWDVIGKNFLEVTNSMLQARRVAPSHTKGVMVLIPKVPRPSKMSDLRPVTLLDVDGKVFSRVMTREDHARRPGRRPGQHRRRGPRQPAARGESGGLLGGPGHRGGV